MVSTKLLHLRRGGNILYKSLLNIILNITEYWWNFQTLKQTHSNLTLALKMELADSQAEKKNQLANNTENPQN